MAAGYAFVTEWWVPAAPERCWAEFKRMLAPGAGGSWWTAVHVDPPPTMLAAGQSLGLAVRSPFGYTLRSLIVLEEVRPGNFLSATSDGDLRGHGTLRIDRAEAGAVLVWTWDVSTQRHWMNTTAFLLRPAFAAAHRRVMAAGEKGMLRALTGTSHR